MLSDDERAQLRRCPGTCWKTEIREAPDGRLTEWLFRDCDVCSCRCHHWPVTEADIARLRRAADWHVNASIRRIIQVLLAERELSTRMQSLVATLAITEGADALALLRLEAQSIMRVLEEARDG